MIVRQSHRADRQPCLLGGPRESKHTRGETFGRPFRSARLGQDSTCARSATRMDAAPRVRKFRCNRDETEARRHHIVLTALLAWRGSLPPPRNCALLRVRTPRSGHLTSTRHAGVHRAGRSRSSPCCRTAARLHGCTAARLHGCTAAIFSKYVRTSSSCFFPWCQRTRP